jgi:hypothetical protein
MALAQFFNVSVPIGGVSTVALDGFYVFFNKVSNTVGVDFQVREVANGVPTYNVIQNSRKTIRPTDTYANGQLVLRTSTNSNTATHVNFRKPVLLQTQKTYALMVMPHNSDPDYKMFTASTPNNDLISGLPVKFSPAIGPLYFWEVGHQTPIPNKALKFYFLWTLANNTRHHDDNYNFNEEHVIVNDFTAPFVTGEHCYMANTHYDFISADLYTGGPFTNGEDFYQDDGSGTISYGTIYSANNTKLLLNVTYGSVSNCFQITGVTSSSTGWIGAMSSGVTCSNTANTITVPYVGNGVSNLFYSNQSIYLAKNDWSQTQVFIVTGVTGNTVQLSWKPNFSDVGCHIGHIRGDGLGLRMNYQGANRVKENNYVANFENSTANTQINANFHFGNSVGKYIIGQSSRARCRSFGTIDLEYHAVVPQLHYDQIPENEHFLYWGGYQSYKSWQSDYPIAWRYIKELKG